MNYSLLRALSAHLIKIVQNAQINKMTMRNVGIVFSPTLGIPAGIFSIMLGEFTRVFNVDGAEDEAEAEEQRLAEEAAHDQANQEQERPGGGLYRRNSQRYSDTAADKLLGLSGRQLNATGMS
jgi:RalA-binding protein 1